MPVCFHILSVMAFFIMPDCLGNNIHVGMGYCLMPSRHLEMRPVHTPGKLAEQCSVANMCRGRPTPPSYRASRTALAQPVRDTADLQTSSAKDAAEAECRFTRGIKSAWLLSTYPTEEQLFLLLRCTQTLVMHDKTTLQSCLVFLLKLLMQNTAYIRNALIQYGKSYVLSLSLIVNKVQNTDFFCRHEY